MGLSHVRKEWAALEGKGKVALLRNQERNGPHEFAEALVADFRQKHEADGTRWTGSFPYSDNGIRDLVDLAFYASLLQEEARAVRFRVIFGSDNARLLPHAVVVKFTSPLPMQDPSDLVKLAPALSRENIALWITETLDASGNSCLYCLGLLDLAFDAHDFVIGFPDGTVATVMSFGNTIINDVAYFNLKVEGCGHLRASFAGHWEYTLRAGTITPFQIVAEAPPAGVLFRETSQLLSDELVRAGSQHNAPVPLPQVQPAIIAFWARVLKLVVSRRHGGCFIVVPETATTAEALFDRYGVRDGYPVKVDIGQYLFDLFQASEALHLLRKSLPTQCNSNSLRELSDLEQKWLIRRRNLRFTITTLADLTAIDGCVMMDRHLCCHLFGAKLERQPGSAASPGGPRELRDWYSRVSLEEAIKKLGKRNGSACDFCRDHPGALAFVVSQDTDLRLYYSDDQFTYRFDNLSAG